jgi:hypothetical protein
MTTPQTFEAKLSFKLDYQEPHMGLSSVLAAAVVNRGFRETLLRDPKMALKQGYLGKGFALSQAETSLLTSIQAVSLTDLAQQVVFSKGEGD